MTMSFKDQGAQRPTAMGSLLQASAYGATIPVIYGQTQSNLLAIWAANIRAGGAGNKKFKSKKKNQTNYVENIDFLLGHNPIMGVLQIVENGSNLPLNFTSQSFTGTGGRQAFTVTDSKFYFVTAVTLAAAYSFTVNDYGGPGPQTLSGTWEIPLWNELEVGPDPTNPMSYRAAPFCYRWQPGFGATIQIDAESFPAGTVKVYYAQLSDAEGFLEMLAGIEPPLTQIYCFFEPQLGSGDEYATAGDDPAGHPYTEQQIIYPHFAGVGSSAINLGASGTLPQLNPEVRGKWGVYPTGDADFVDMIEDIYKSGVAQAAIAAANSAQPEPPGTQMERGLSSYDLPGTVQKKLDSSNTAVLPPMQYDMPNTAQNILVCVATGTGALAISSTNGEAWTAVYPAGRGYQLWHSLAAGGPNTVTVSGASAPWQMSILEIGGVGGPVANAVTVVATLNSNAAGGGATAATTNSTGLMQNHGNTLIEAQMSWTGFEWPALPVGAVVTAIQPIVTYEARAASMPSSALAFLPAPYPGASEVPLEDFPIPPYDGETYSGTWTGGSIGTSEASLTACIMGFYIQCTEGFASIEAYLNVTSIGLLVSYTVPPGYLGGETLDAVATSPQTGQPVAANSTVAEGLPAYLLAISLYPDGGAPAVQDQPLWRAVTPVNFAGLSPTTFQAQERIIHSPGTYQAVGAGGSPASICLLAVKAAGPVPYPKPLGDFIDLPSFDLVRAQCRANGLYGSLTMNSQSSASDWIKTLSSAADAAPVFLGAKLFLYPYSEVSAAGNGAFYSAPSAVGPVAELNADNGDFISSDGCPVLDTADRIDLPNVLQMQCIDREANYAQVTVQTPDPATLGLYGVRKQDATTNNAIQDPTIARTLLGIQVRRNQYGGDKWTFTTTARWSLLSPMDLITLTDELQGIAGVPVRITSFKEQDDGSFQAEAEPFVYGMCAPTLLAATSPNPTPISTQQGAGDANAPIIFEPTPGLYPGSAGYEIWVVVSSANDNYGGAQIFVSTDGGESYQPAPGGADANSNTVVGSAVTGIVVADWPAANDPDSTNNLEVDLTESNGIMQSSSTVVENNFEVPCYVEADGIEVDAGGTGIATGDPLLVEAGGVPVATLGTVEAGGTPIAAGGGDGFGYELMTYAVATLTAANKYTLAATGAGNFLRRSILNAPSSSGVGVDHALGRRFAVVGPSAQGILKMALPTQYIGQAIYFKICTFNTFGAALQSQGDVQPYIYVPTGVPGAA